MLQGYLDLLHDSDPTRRIQALQVLAMLEETQALNTIQHLFKNDPDPQVRQMAKWAGSLIWQAQQRGYTTEKGMAEYFEAKHKPAPNRHDSVITSVMMQAGNDSGLDAELGVIQQKWDMVEEVRQPNKRSTLTQTQTFPDDHLDLLEAGLSPKITEINELDAGLSDFFKS